MDRRENYAIRPRCLRDRMERTAIAHPPSMFALWIGRLARIQVQTARAFCRPGAKRSFWLRTKQGYLAEGLPSVARSALRGDCRQRTWSGVHEFRAVIVESNSLMQFVKPSLYFAVIDPMKDDFQGVRADGTGSRACAGDAWDNVRRWTARTLWMKLPEQLLREKPSVLQREGEKLPEPLWALVHRILEGPPSVWRLKAFDNVGLQFRHLRSLTLFGGTVIINRYWGYPSSQRFALLRKCNAIGKLAEISETTLGVYIGQAVLFCSEGALDGVVCTSRRGTAGRTCASSMASGRLGRAGGNSRKERRGVPRCPSRPRKGIGTANWKPIPP